ncbi:MAG: pseudouridine synthase [Planctomycetes bacterium]|nr:pseudouridine synthase [Planctomycetota bacterium]
MSEKERLQKVLARAGLGSRRECEEVILAGRVSVNGRPVRELGVKVDAEHDRVVCDGEALRAERLVYFVVNKPRGMICSNSKVGGRLRVVDLLRHVNERLYTVGRLDMDSEGLLIVTNDGELCNLLTHPRYGVPKTYLVKVRGLLEGPALQKIQQGVWLSEGKTAPARVRILKRTRQCTSAEVTLLEGKNREVRRVFARVGHPVSYLKRVKVGDLAIGDLRPGHSQSISRDALLAAVGAAMEVGYLRARREPARGRGASSPAHGRGAPPRGGPRKGGDPRKRGTPPPGTRRPAATAGREEEAGGEEE